MIPFKIDSRWARWCIRSIYCFDDINGKSQVTQGRLYSEERKRRALGIIKGKAQWQKNPIEIMKHQKLIKQFQVHPWLPRCVWGEAEDTITR
jgi:hypothetical protein